MCLSKFIFLCIIFGAYIVGGGPGYGCNWGTRATHPLPPKIVVKLLKDNGFDKVKLFESNPDVLRALQNSGIQVMVGIPNELLATLAAGSQAAIDWVSQNVLPFVDGGAVDIRYVAVGNEPFLKINGDQYLQTTAPAVQNIQAALNQAGLGDKIKATIPLNADVYQSTNGNPSEGDFRPDIKDIMISLVQLLKDIGSPVIINIYPFLSLNQDPNFPIDFAFFDSTTHPIVDGSTTYTNVFEASYDMLLWTLEKNGFPDMPVIVGEVGWPTDGAPNANIENARKFNQGLVNWILQGKGTPKSPKALDVYIFSLIDEDLKDTGNYDMYFERHWGMFYFDGKLKYELEMGNGRSLAAAQGVTYLENKWCVMAPYASLSDPNLEDAIDYACDRADCSRLAQGASCGSLDARNNVSFAFNIYYQTMNQHEEACNFNNLATVTTIDPSQGSCRFDIMIDISNSTGSPLFAPSLKKVLWTILCTLACIYVVCTPVGLW